MRWAQPGQCHSSMIMNAIIEDDGLSSSKSSNESFHVHAITGLRIFFAVLVIALCLSQKLGKLFFASHGQLHRTAGAAHLSWLILGAVGVVHPEPNDSWSLKCLFYDIILGLLGIFATLSAARDFPHRHVSNHPGESGTLSSAAIVTQREMVEHSFYQGLNLWQAIYLHAITRWRTTMVCRFVLLWMVTLPWLARTMFPVNSFSANWRTKNGKDTDERKNGHSVKHEGAVEETKSFSSINRMYQIKKWQYIFYKHVILHGLNISMATNQEHDDLVLPLPLTFQWRVFWICLNASYVMEFFMQSLVKRRVLSQSLMILLQWILMLSSSLAAFSAVMGRLCFEAAALSLVLNFVNRHHDILNTLLVGVVISTVSKFLS